MADSRLNFSPLRTSRKSIGQREMARQTSRNASLKAITKTSIAKPKARSPSPKVLSKLLCCPNLRYLSTHTFNVSDTHRITINSLLDELKVDSQGLLRPHSPFTYIPERFKYIVEVTTRVPTQDDHGWPEMELLRGERAWQWFVNIEDEGDVNEESEEVEDERWDEEPGDTETSTATDSRSSSPRKWSKADDTGVEWFEGVRHSRKQGFERSMIERKASGEGSRKIGRESTPMDITEQFGFDFTNRSPQKETTYVDTSENLELRASKKRRAVSRGNLAGTSPITPSRPKSLSELGRSAKVKENISSLGGYGYDKAKRLKITPRPPRKIKRKWLEITWRDIPDDFDNQVREGKDCLRLHCADESHGGSVWSFQVLEKVSEKREMKKEETRQRVASMLAAMGSEEPEEEEEDEGEAMDEGEFYDRSEHGGEEGTDHEMEDVSWSNPAVSGKKKRPRKNSSGDEDWKP